MLRYADEDGELISLKDNDDLWEAVTSLCESAAEKKIIRIIVELPPSPAAAE